VVNLIIFISKDDEISLKICKVFMFFKNKILKKNSSICEIFSPKKEKKKKHSMGKDYFSLVVESLCIFIFQVASHIGFKYLSTCTRENYYFCLANHMDAHVVVGKCLAIHHLGLVPDWGGRNKKMNFKDELQAKVFFGLLCD